VTPFEPFKALKKIPKKRKKLPGWIFLPVVLAIRAMKLLMITRINDPFNCFEYARNNPCISVTWHNRLFLFPAMFPSYLRRRTSAIVSPSRDGQYVVDVIRYFGIKDIRGSSSKGGSAAMSEAIRQLKTGQNVSFTPDGPRGPKYKMKKGPIQLAAKMQVPLIPVAVNYSSFWEAPSWDGFQIPKPLSLITLNVGEPIRIPSDISDEEEKEWQSFVEKRLKDVSMVKS
jgi:hypothetical protein